VKPEKCVTKAVEKAQDVVATMSRPALATAIRKLLDILDDA